MMPQRLPRLFRSWGGAWRADLRAGLQSAAGRIALTSFVRKLPGHHHRDSKWFTPGSVKRRLELPRNSTAPARAPSTTGVVTHGDTSSLHDCGQVLGKLPVPPLPREPKASELHHKPLAQGLTVLLVAAENKPQARYEPSCDSGCWFFKRSKYQAKVTAQARPSL